MEPISVAKKLKIIRMYFAGNPYDDIAQKCNVAKGTVSNVIGELKNGLIPEITTIVEDIEVLRDLSVALKHSKISPVQASIGFAVVDMLFAVKLEPAQIEKVHTLLGVLTPPGLDLAAMAKSVLAIESLKTETGLTLEQLEEKVTSLKVSAAKLEPVAQEVESLEKEHDDLEKENSELVEKNKNLKDKNNALEIGNNSLLVTQAKLQKNAILLEERAHTADKKLTTARQDLDKLESLGMDQQALSHFASQVKDMAARHCIKTEELNGYLLEQLKLLEKELDLDSVIQEKKTNLNELKKQLTSMQTDIEKHRSRLEKLVVEESVAKQTLDYQQHQVCYFISQVNVAAQKAFDDIKASIASCADETAAEVARIKDEALDAGSQMGILRANIESMNWVKPMISLVQGTGELDIKQFRVITLMVLKGVLIWLRDHSGGKLDYLKQYIQVAIKELERDIS